MELYELYETLTKYIGLEEQIWLVTMWCMVFVFPYLFIKTSERAIAYCEHHNARLTTRGIRAIALVYLAIYIVFISAYFVRFR